MLSVENCLFCSNDKSQQHIIIKTKNFKVLGNSGPVVEGHILLVTNDHENSMGSLNGKEFEEFNIIYTNLLKFLKEVYKMQIITFEHGNIHQSIYHAHMHFIPLKNNLSISDFVSTPENYRLINSLDMIQQEYKQDNHYLFLGIDESKYLVKPEIGYTGFFRKRIAEILEIPERATWDEVINNQAISHTIKKEIRNLERKWLEYQNKFDLTFLHHLIQV